jgi:hypothetical protein
MAVLQKGEEEVEETTVELEMVAMEPKKVATKNQNDEADKKFYLATLNHKVTQIGNRMESRMKRLLLLFTLLQFNGCSKEIQIENKNQTPLTAQSFQDVWQEVISDPLTALPQNSISFGKLFTFSKNIILNDAKRTLVERADILEPFDKLAHPNGVCLQGLWEINQKNPYSGYFKNHTKALIIARASSAMSKTKRGEIRAFGLAGKIFPTTNKKQINHEATANFFVIDDLGGTNAQHYTDVKLTNEPKVTTTSQVVKNLLYALKVAKAFATADKNPGIRQLYEISELGEEDKQNIITPKWIKISARAGQTVDAKDFRNEFIFTNNKIMIFDIAVASKEKKGKKEWHTIGNIHFNGSIISKSCDHRLHFHHPKWRNDLKYF